MGTDEAAGNLFLGNKLVDALFDESRDILILATDGLEIARINQSASIFLGQSLESLLGRGMGALFGDEGMERFKAVAALLRIDGETVKAHFELTDYLGERHRLLTGVRYVRCADCGRNYYLFVIRRNRRSDTQAMDHIDPEIFVHRLLKGLSDSAMFIDVASRTIIDCNLASEALFGYPRSELVGRSPQFLAGSEDHAKLHIARSRESYAKTGFYQEKMLCRRKDGSQFLTLATNIAFFSSAGEHKYTMAINRDLSAEERRFDEIIRLSEQSKRLLQDLNESIQPLRASGPSETLSGLGFSARQIEIAAILMTGETTKAIADRLKLSESAIKSHLSAMYRRVGLSSRMEFVRFLHDRRIRVE